MTFRTRLVVLLVSTPLVAFAVVGGLLGKTVTREESYQHLRIFEDVVSLIVNNYVEEVEVDRVMEGAMRGLADGLDPDTSYLTPAEVSLVERKVEPEPGDVGIELTRQYYLRVIAARDGSPAARAGLHTGDYVRVIDGEPTRHMSPSRARSPSCGKRCRRRSSRPGSRPPAWASCGSPASTVTWPTRFAPGSRSCARAAWIA
jgi:carboxyl-terminal processing protease